MKRETASGRISRISTELRAEGYRLTLQRMAILHALIGNMSHPSVEELHERVKVDYPQLSLATVYRLVNLLKEHGEILEVNPRVFGARYDGCNPIPHPHLICIECGAVEDVEVLGREWFTSIEQEVSQKTGYRIIRCNTDFFGICPRCQQRSAA
ncbi:MAG: transcriptional repressor [Chloroflexota bacterium]|nr:transcriptional repressor [Chloroflexota bacterium]